MKEQTKYHEEIDQKSYSITKACIAKRCLF